MANEEHLEILLSGVDKWNQWREENRDKRPDLSYGNFSSADFSAANLHWVNLSGASLVKTKLKRANLSRANLQEALLWGANLSGADLSMAKVNNGDLRWVNLREARLIGTDLSDVDLTEADLSNAILGGARLHNAYMIKTNLNKADLSKANLNKADLSKANLNKADLSSVKMQGTILTETNLTETDLIRADLSKATLFKANMQYCMLIGTNFSKATLEECSIYGISAWDINLEDSIQKNLIISPDDQATITVDNLKVAQFIYLLLNNAEIRDVLDTITGKAALILGRFTEERKAVLDGIRDALRAKGYLPILFDFEKPTSRDLTETVVTLAHLSRFVIADLTSPSSIPHELMSFTRDLPSVPVQPIILKEHRQYAMFEHLQRYNWVLPVHEYESQDSLILELNEKVIEPLEKKSLEQRPKPL